MTVTPPPAPYRRYDPAQAYHVQYRHTDPATGLVVAATPTTSR